MTPAIALTGYATAGDQEKTLQAGYDNHVGKPISHDTFVDIIDEVYRTKLDKGKPLRLGLEMAQSRSHGDSDQESQHPERGEPSRQSGLRALPP
ncbi:hypothetical protein ACIQAL_09180 [Pseudomonas sp. NPDC088368]|uniref:hypothetical protein n=1 Tax=Pseudomonas sp. NPDC088368 TaxID=3364453 RepID=UPI0037F601B7